MATRWRIRHKLLMGLGLVVGIIAILLTGTYQGLSSYIDTMKTADSKLAELELAEELKRSLVGLLAPAENAANPSEEEAQLRNRIRGAQAAQEAYRVRLQDTLRRKRDPDLGEHETALLAELNATYHQLLVSIDKSKAPKVLGDGDSRQLLDDPAIQAAGKKQLQYATELRLAIYDDLYRQLAVAKVQHRQSMGIVITSGIGAMILMAVLLRYFYTWVFFPLHDLQAGVKRVAQGDFEHRIELDSGDEMQELAEAFNEMSGKLQSIYADLNRQVLERSKQLVRSERLAGVGFLAAGVAHEINNPLASIAFCSEALERRLGELVARFPREQEVVQKYLKMIQQEAFRCKTITQNLLEFSRVGEGQRTMTDLVEIVQSVLEMVQHLRNCHGKRIVFRPTSRLMAFANPQEIKQVVLNLVVNALDSLDDGGSLTIALAPAGDSAELTFADTGCGMPPDVLENIFEPFFTRSRTGKGTGLGLSISHRIVSQHGGEIEASSPGTHQGSTFVVRLPLQPAEPQEEPHHGFAAAA